VSYEGSAADYDVAAAEAKARNPRLETRVAAREDMFTPTGSLRRYFEVGESALSCICAGLDAANAGTPAKILDLPSGYGRVLRHMRALWPEAQITAMDLVAGAVEFCAATFGARPVVSRQPVWLVTEAGEDYDLLWCGSLLTHFDSPDWEPTLRYFRDRLRPGGTLVFTTHGELPIDSLAGDPAAVARIGRWVPPDYGMGPAALEMARCARDSGFAFTHYQNDTRPYGFSVSTPTWVQEAVRNVPGFKFVLHQPAGWFDHQDVWTFVRAG
jgi:SAM-dependent methyltransferase